MTIDVKSMFSNEQLDTFDEFNMGVTKPKVVYVEIDKLHGHEKNRDVNQSKVMELVQSILTSGLHQNPLIIAHPIIPNEYKIIAGHHRVEAIRYIVHTLNKREFINVSCNLTSMDELDAELAMYDTNLVVAELSNYDKMIAIGRKEEIIQLKRSRGDDLPGIPRDIIAKDVQLKPTQVQTYLTLYKNAPDELKQQLKDDSITLSAAMKYLKQQKDKDKVKEKKTVTKSQWLKNVEKILKQGKNLGYVETSTYEGVLEIIKEDS